MKKVLQSSLLIALFLGISSPAKACEHPECPVILGSLGGLVAMGATVGSALASGWSASARNVAEQKLPASDEKDTIKNELRAGTIAYGISAAAGGLVVMIAVCFAHTLKNDKDNRIFVAAFTGLALVASMIGMGVNGDAYHTARAFFSDNLFDRMLDVSIVGLSLNVVSSGLLTLAYRSLRNQATPADPSGPPV